MPRWWSTRLSSPAFGFRNPKAPSSPRSNAVRSLMRDATRETPSFYEPADQHPLLIGTAVSVRNTIFPTSTYERSRHKEYGQVIPASAAQTDAVSLYRRRRMSHYKPT